MLCSRSDILSCRGKVSESERLMYGRIEMPQSLLNIGSYLSSSSSSSPTSPFSPGLLKGPGAASDSLELS